jgi:hypothetical protein
MDDESQVELGQAEPKEGMVHHLTLGDMKTIQVQITRTTCHP